jgi:4-nitrophenyl phosphatase
MSSQRPIVALLLDMDSVIWINGTPIAGAVEALNSLRQIGVRVALVTNNSGKTRSQYAAFLERIGVSGFTPDDIFTAGYATALYVKRHNALNSGILSPVGTSQQRLHHPHTLLSPDPAVKAVICGLGYHFTWAELCRGIYLVKKFGARLLAVCPDPRFQQGRGVLVPGSGAIARAFEIACGVKATVMGKRAQPMFAAVIGALGVAPEDDVMVGDQLATDIAFAALSGARSVLVLSGVDTEQDVAKVPEAARPTYVLPSLVQVVDLVREIGVRA